MLCSNVPGTGHEETKVGDTFTHRKAQTTLRGFEPLRAEPNGFLVHLLNHSDTVSCHELKNVASLQTGVEID